MAKPPPKRTTDDQLREQLKSHQARLAELLKVGEANLTESKKMEVSYLRQEIKQINGFLERRAAKTA